MKLGALFSLAVVATASAFGFVVEDTIATRNASLPSLPARHGRSLKSLQDCKAPRGSVPGKWFYDSRNTRGYYGCTDKHDDMGRPWIMLNAYRRGGPNKKGRYWKYPDGLYDPQCLENWTYYDADATTVLARANGRTTTVADKKHKPWCAMFVYQRGGRRGYQWDYCACPSEWPQP